jgi:hypothetical protein
LIENESKVKTKIIQVDFSGGYEIYEPIGKELEGFEIGVLGWYISELKPVFSYLKKQV